MRVDAASLLPLALVATAVLTGCEGGKSVSSPGGNCVSHYESVATAPTWKQLEDELLRSRAYGRVASIRTVARDVVGGGNRKVERVVDLVDHRDRRLVQADVWRTRSQAWRAGVWEQCIE
jgi:hypothetical protein